MGSFFLERSTYIAARMVHRLLIVLAREPKRTRLPPTLDLRPGYPCRIETNYHCIALEQLSGRRPATSVHRYRFILRTWFSLTTLRGLVRIPSCLVRRTPTKKRECSAVVPADKDRNYIDKITALLLLRKKALFKAKRMAATTSPSRRWCQ